MIENLITPDSIIFELEGNERDEVLAELTENLISRNACLDRNEVFQALVAREEKMSTIVEQSIAVPHIVSKSVQKTIVSLGISHDGVEFDVTASAKESGVAKIVFCIIFPDSNSDEHLGILKDILELSHKDDFLQKILGCKNIRDICDLIFNYLNT